jgi:arylsulfatase A-like enzyme
MMIISPHSDQPATGSTALPTGRALTADRIPIVSVVVATTAAIVVIKSVIAYRDLSHPGTSPLLFDGRWGVFAVRMFLCSAQDMAVGSIILASALLLAGRLGERGRVILRALVRIAAAGAIAWMLVNLQTFHVLRRFVNLSLIELAGGLRVERSIYGYAPLSLVAVIVAVPLATLLASAILGAVLIRFQGAVTMWLLRPAFLLGYAVVFSGLSIVAANRWFTPATGDFPQNPHLLLARSLLRSLHSTRFPPPDPNATRLLQPLRARQDVAVDGQRPRNIIIIVLESVSSVYFHDYGSPFQTTRQLESLADRSLLFENFYSASTNTVPSGLAIFGSEYNQFNGQPTVMAYPRYPVASAPEWLRQHGYRTVFLAGGDWNYANLPHYLSGFDLARDGFQHWSKETRKWPLTRDQYSDADLFQDARRAIEELRNGRQPFLLVLWSYDGHSPYRAGPCDVTFNDSDFPSAIRTVNEDPRLLPSQKIEAEKPAEFHRYLASICRDDQLIGALVGDLDRTGLADSTIVAITGDHGEAFGQHGWFGHGNGLYEEDVHVPLILISRALHRFGPRSTVAGSQVDLWPTLASICQIPPHPDWQGRSLLGEEHPPAFFYRAGGIGVREGRYKYIFDYSSDENLLFDLSSDPREQRNLAGDQPELVARFRSRVTNWASFSDERTQQRLDGKP